VQTLNHPKRRLLDGLCVCVRILDLHVEPYGLGSPQHHCMMQA
jgi:hypothetical protein